MKSVYSKEYALLLRALIDGRKAASLTQNDLASLLRKPQSFVSKYERRERRLDVVELVEICRLLHIDPHLIVTEIETCASTTNGANK